MRLSALFTIALSAAAPLFSQSLAEFMSASGAVYWYNSAGKNSLPCKQWPVILARLDSAGERLDSAETRTDSYGQYAFYGLDSGEYELEIPKGFGRSFRKKMRVPGKAAPIVLPPRLPALRDSSVFPIQVDADYEKDPMAPKRYNFRLWTNVPPEWKPLVRKVRYFMNHPTFIRKYLTGSDSAKNFAAGYYGWGCLQNVSVEVFFAHETWTVEFPFCADLREKAQARKAGQPPVK